MKQLPLILFAVFVCGDSSLSPSASTQKVWTPTEISSCFKGPELRKSKIDSRVNPYYLRGDFDGDGKPDFAVMILGPNSESSGLAICHGNGQRFVLGAGSVPKFSTWKDDNFLSSEWEVATLSQFRELVYDKKAGINAKGEVIVLWWEDGSAYIFWDGEKYRWLSEPAGGPH